MKIECVKNKLTELILKADRVVGKNQNLPILGCFLLKVNNGTLSVSATNLDLGVRGEMPVRVFKEGQAAVPAQVLSGFLSQLPNEGNISLEVEEGRLLVSSKYSKTNIKLLNSEDFPTLPSVQGGLSTTIAPQDLIKGFQSVWFSAATSSMKPELSSVYVFYDQKQLVFVATDSFRLAEKRISIKKQTDFQPILIPFKNVADIIRLFENEKSDIEFVFNKNQAAIRGAGLEVVSRLIEGTFPDYQQIIPKDHKTEVVVLKQDILSALKISTIFSGAFHRVDFSLSPTKKSFEVSSESDHIGKNTINPEAVIKGEEVKISFNLKYLTDCFQAIHQDSVTLHFSGAHKPLIIRGVGDSSFTYLVMPMNR